MNSQKTSSLYSESRINNGSTGLDLGDDRPPNMKVKKMKMLREWQNDKNTIRRLKKIITPF